MLQTPASRGARITIPGRVFFRDMADTEFIFSLQAICDDNPDTLIYTKLAGKQKYVNVEVSQYQNIRPIIFAP